MVTCDQVLVLPVVGITSVYRLPAMSAILESGKNADLERESAFATIGGECRGGPPSRNPKIRYWCWLCNLS